MGSNSTPRNRLLNQLTINLGKPPDHAARSTTLDNNSFSYDDGGCSDHRQRVPKAIQD